MNLISMERVSESCALDSKSLISDDGNADFSGIKALGQHLAQKADCMKEYSQTEIDNFKRQKRSKKLQGNLLNVMRKLTKN